VGFVVPVNTGDLPSEEIAFSAGSHNEVIRLSYNDFDRLVKPQVLRFVAGKAHAA
jgi:prolyl-tRNA editing enzyme YbaK/EbsC (Cys-tRNA(Pro) deacylase)